MAIVRTIMLVILFFAALFGLLPFAILSFLLSFVGLRKQMSHFMYRIAQGWARIALFSTGCPLDVKGRENVPLKEGVCIVSNHDGLFDIILALAFIGRPFGFVAKKELLYIPFLNIWIWLLGGLFIDRRNPKKALKTIEAGVKRIRNGGSMIIFPEGTRSRGRGLQPFRPGAFKLATQAEAVIVPMTISGSYDAFEKTGLVQNVPIDVIFGEAISTADIPLADRKQVLSDKVHKVIEEALKTTAMKDLNKLNR